MTRRGFLGSFASLAAVPRSFAQTGPPIPVSRINHMMLNVSTYCGGNGYLANECGTPENPTGRLG